MNEDSNEEILNHLGTTSGIPKKLSLVNKQLRTWIDSIYDKALDAQELQVLNR